MKTAFEEFGGTYIAVGDYLLPNLTLPAGKEIGIYGLCHRRFLKENQPIFYTTLLLQGKLEEYLLNVDEQAKQMKEQIVREMAVKDGLDEALKESAPTEWVGRMNQCCHAAEEILNRELIYHLAVNQDG